MQSIPDEPYIFYSEQQENHTNDNPDTFLSCMAEIVELSHKVQAEFPFTKGVCIDWIESAAFRKGMDASDSDSTLIYSDKCETARHVEVTDGMLQVVDGDAMKKSMDEMYQLVPPSSLTWKDHELYSQCLSNEIFRDQYSEEFAKLKERIEFEQRVFRIWDKALASLRRDRFDHFPREAQQFTNVNMINGRSYWTKEESVCTHSTLQSIVIIAPCLSMRQRKRTSL
jgi:hypothetical protein